MKKLLTIAMATVIALVGCQGTNTNDTTNKDRTPTENTRYEQTRYNDTNITHNERFSQMKNREDRLNSRDERNGGDYRVSKEAAERITSEIDEISNAYVLTTNNNAYVAATLKARDDRNKDNNTNVDRTRAGDGNVTDRNRTNNDQVTDRNRNTNEDNNRDTNRDTNRNHDNLNVYHDGDDLTDDVKNQIADIVQSVDNDINNVYVTTSPDFIDLFERYSNDLDAGKPVRGLFDQIGNAIERMFPQESSKGNHSR